MSNGCGFRSPVYPAQCLISVLRCVLQRSRGICSGCFFSYWFLRTGWTEERGSRKYFLLNEHFDSLHLRTLRCKGHWGRSLAVISICSQKSCHACFEPDLESLEIFGPKCLPRCYLRCFLFVRQVLLDMIECMDQPSLICIKTGQYISLQLDLGSLLFIPDLSDGIFCCLCQATSILFPFL